MSCKYLPYLFPNLKFCCIFKHAEKKKYKFGKQTQIQQVLYYIFIEPLAAIPSTGKYLILMLMLTGN